MPPKKVQVGQVRGQTGHFVAKDGPNQPEIMTFLKGCAKRWTFQKEESKDGFTHWQFTVDLKKKARPEAWRATWPKEWVGHTTPIKDAKAAWNYAGKADTRVDGPWMHTDSGGEEPESKAMTEHKKKIIARDREPWFAAVIALCLVYDHRSINFLYDPQGDIGKGNCTVLLWALGIAYRIPNMADGEKLTQFVKSCCFGKKAYVTDVPRSGNTTASFWAGMEGIKDGWAHDTRYKGVQDNMDRPVIWVWGNDLPNFKFLTPGRWKIWMVNHSKQLVRYTEQRMQVKQIKRAEEEKANPLKRKEIDDVDNDEVEWLARKKAKGSPVGAGVPKLRGPVVPEV